MELSETGKYEDQEFLSSEILDALDKLPPAASWDNIQALALAGIYLELAKISKKNPRNTSAWGDFETR